MEKGKKIIYFQVLRVLLVFVMGAALLTGCSGNTEGTIYLTGVSRLKIVVNGSGKVKETRALNKAGNTLLEENSWKGEAVDTALDVIIPLLRSEDTETVYVDVFSDDKSWENGEVQRLTEKYSILDEGETPVEVRGIRDIDSMEEVWNGEAVSAAYEETEASEEETAEEETSPQETEEEETSAGETTEEETETEETTTEAPTTAAPTTAAQRTQPAARSTTAASRPTAARTTAAPPETTAQRVTETLPPEETLPQAPETTEGAAETAAAPEMTAASESTAAPEETKAPEETESPEASPERERSTEEETTRSSVYIPPSEREEPYGPGWTEEE